MSEVVSQRSLHSVDTVYSACALEFCPHEGYRDLAACGLYQLVDGTTQTRTGRLLLYQVSKPPNAQLAEKSRRDAAAILDVEWSHHTKVDGKPTLVQAGADGNAELLAVSRSDSSDNIDISHVMTLKDDDLADGVLCLSARWSDRVKSASNGDSRILATYSDGSAKIFQPFAAGNSTQPVISWDAHGPAEAWVSGFDYWNDNVVYTGGDDVSFNVWDLRTDPSAGSQVEAVEVSRRNKKAHDAGVTAIQSHHLREHILATGSYDERVLIWDIRNLARALTTSADVSVGGGVWRLKWHPTQPHALAVAAMYNGFHILHVEDDGSWRRTNEFMEHSSIAYGIDWSYDASDPSKSLVSSCSFYDHICHLWEAHI
ncbi:WD40 repeat-like protein [Ramicandelaber brevisporus]|nr:WD40 repeat-like protein [Ramicandelaber brevisporus]